MDFAAAQHVDRATWRRYLFYIDLAVIGMFVLSVILLVRHTFLAGQFYELGQFNLSTRTLWLVAGDTAFLAVTLSWIFYRFFRNQYLVLTRRF